MMKKGYLLILLVLVTFFGHAINLPQSGHQTLTSCNEKIYDSGGENNGISPNSDGSITITSGSLSRLALRLEKLDIGFFADALTIYDGDSEESPIIIRLKGAKSDFELNNQREYISSSNSVTIKLETGNFADPENSGFQILVRCLDESNVITFQDSNTKTVIACSGTLVDHGGLFMDMEKQKSDELLILPDEPNKIVQIKFEQMKLGSGQINFLGGVYPDYPNKIRTTYVRGGGINKDLLLTSARPDGSMKLNISSGNQSIQGMRGIISCVDGLTESALNNMPISGTKTISTCSETIYDNGGKSGAYLANSQSTLFLSPSEENQRLVLNFEEFSTITDEDVLTIYDGQNLSTTPLRTISGNDLPSAISATDELKELTLVFTSNSLNESNGFEINVGCEEVPPPLESGQIPRTGRTIDTTCNLNITNLRRTSTDEYYPNADGAITIYPEDENKDLFLSFNYRNTWTQGDTLWLYDGENIADSLLVKKFDLQETKIGDYHLKRGAMTLRFTSDNFLERYGVDAQVVCVDTNEFVGRVPYSGVDTLYTCSDTIYDYGGPGIERNVSRHARGTLIIKPTEEGKMIQLEQIYRKFDDGSNSQFNIYDSIGRYIDKEFDLSDFDEFLRFGTVTSTTGPVTMYYNPLPSFRERGFAYIARCVDLADTIEISNFGVDTLKTCNGKIQHGMGIGYPNNTRGSVVVLPKEEGKVIQLTIKDFVIDETDFLKVYDGTTTDFRSVLLYEESLRREFNRYNAPKVTSVSGPLTVQIKSNGNDIIGWFSGFLTCVDPMETEHVVPFADTTTLITCGTSISDHANTNLNYKNNVDGVLTIIPDQLNKRVKLDFLDFDTNPEDILYVYGEDVSSASNVFSGDVLPSDIISEKEDGSITLRFQSNGTETNRGFSVQSTCINKPEEDDEEQNETIFFLENDTLTSCNDSISTIISLNDPRDVEYITFRPAGENKFLLLDLDISSSFNAIPFIYDTNNDFIDTVKETRSNIIAPTVDGSFTMSIRAQDTTDFISILSINAKMSCVDVPDVRFDQLPYNDSLSLELCSGYIQDHGGFASMYSSGNNYSVLTLLPDDPLKTLNLSILEHDLALDDTLLVYDEELNENRLLGTFYGLELNKTILQGSGSGEPIVLVFKGSSESGLGFLIEAFCDINVGTNENQINRSVIISPNPTNGLFYIHDEQSSVNDTYQIEVLSLTGEVQMFETRKSHSLITVETKNLIPGIYIVKYTNSSGKSLSSKIRIE